MHLALVYARGSTPGTLTGHVLEQAHSLAHWLSPVLIVKSRSESAFEGVDADSTMARLSLLDALRFACENMHAELIPMSVGALFLHSVAHVFGCAEVQMFDTIMTDERLKLGEVFFNVLRSPAKLQQLYSEVVAPYYNRADIALRAFYPPNHARHAPLFVGVYDYFVRQGVAGPA